jgi:hypothetical protein
MSNLLAQVPPGLHPRLREIMGLTDDFCRAHLNEEFRDLCRKVAVAAGEAGLPLTSGKAAGWAAGIIGVIGFANFFGDPSHPFHMTTEEIARNVGVSPATLHNKSKAVRDALEIGRFDPRFSTAAMTDQSPFTWILLVNGLPMDIRTAPRGAQEEAFRCGLIPYIPADGPPPSNKREQRDARKPTPARNATRRATKAAPDRPHIYTLIVSLLSGPISDKFARKNRSVIRTIQIRGDQTLQDLHEAIFDAFEREEEHMYEFQMGKGPMDPDGPRYVLPMAAEQDFGPEILGTVDETTIDSMELKEGRQFGYWFDFGDDWQHQIGVERIEDGPGEGTYPRVVARIGSSPPQYQEE